MTRLLTRASGSPPANQTSHTADELFWSRWTRALSVAIFLLAIGIASYAITRWITG